jgi:hypothetical protein
MTALLRGWILLALMLAPLGCGASSSSDPSPVPCTPAPDFTRNAPAQASIGDVQPILARNCALGGCHLSAPGSGDLVLAVGSASWADAVIGVRSHENPSMDLVTPGDPAHSWLVHKIFGALCGYRCDATVGCGAEMPFGGALPDADRGTIVAWIEGGAPLK